GKIVARLEEFEAHGWTRDRLFGAGPQPWGPHGLVYHLPPEWELAEVGPAYCVLLGPPDGTGARAAHRFPRLPWHQLERQLGPGCYDRDRWGAGFYTERRRAS